MPFYWGSRYAYVNAKVHGMRASLRSLDDLRALASRASLASLAVELFPGKEFSGSPEALHVEMQGAILEEGFAVLEHLIDFCPSRSVILSAFLSRYERDDLKRVLTDVLAPLPIPAPRVPPVPHPTFSRQAVDRAETIEELRAALAGTIYADIFPPDPENVVPFELEMAIDRAYFAFLSGVLRRLPRRDREFAVALAAMEVDLHNVAILLRLNRFYGMEESDAASHMLPGGAGAAGAIASRFGSAEELRDLRSGLSRMLFVECRRIFRQDFDSIAPLLAFFRMKIFEMENLRALVESVRLGMPARQAEGALVC